ncbi:valine--tRNA ligase [Caldiplasma sukawensis]
MPEDINSIEEKWMKYWRENPPNYNRDLKNTYIIDTPPPTVSGLPHIGHAFSYPHQDIMGRYKRMRGFNVIYPFGFDNNGLATERYSEKILKVKPGTLQGQDGINKIEMVSKETIRKMTEFFYRMGFSADLENPYITYSKDIWSISQRYFIRMLHDGIAYRNEGMTVRCPVCKTAISQIEMNDEERETWFVYLKFRSEDGKELTIATTRPEMLGACVAIGMNPDDPRADDFKNIKIIVPIFNFSVPVILDDMVKLDKGTGSEMICTFGDQNDFILYQRHNLEYRKIMDENGRLNDGHILSGENIDDGRKIMIENLEKNGFVVKKERIKHSVNVHERCGTPIEIDISKQWFVRYLDRKEDLLEYGRRVNWIPEFMNDRYSNWVRGLKWDWCISRQRLMGIPIPVWYCTHCNSINTPGEEELPVDPRFENGRKCSTCGSDKLIGEKDVMDTWFTSSITPTIVREKYHLKDVPMDVRFQGQDIISTWAFTTIFRSMIHQKDIPWINIVISGNVNDPYGNKMSKSKNNTVDPWEMINKYGADSVRYWSISSTTYEDVNFNEQDMQRGRKTAIKMINAASLLYNESVEKIDILNLNIEKNFNIWILEKLNETIESVTSAMDSYNMSKARFELDNLFWPVFCDSYLEIIKPFLRDEDPSVIKETYNVARYVMEQMLKMYAPIMPFITEEVYHKLGNSNSIHETEWPKSLKIKKVEDFDKTIAIISEIRKTRGKAKSLKKSYEKIIVMIPENFENADRNLIKKLFKDTIEFKEGNELVVEIF